MMVSRDGVAGLRVMIGSRDGAACWLCVCFGGEFFGVVDFWVLKMR